MSIRTLFLIFYGLILTFFASLNLQAQPPIIKSVDIKSYKIQQQDSSLLFSQTRNYDPQGRLLEQQYYYYYPQKKGMLRSEQKAYFDPATNILTETNTTYPFNGTAPLSKKTVTRYWIYAPKEADSKHLWRKAYNQYNEIYKEDTLTYSEDSLLMEHWKYSYEGNTALYGDFFFYNKKRLQKRRKEYFIWTTIDAKGEVVDRRTKRKDYRYCYNAQGKLTKAVGKNYLDRFRQTIRYDKAGRKVEDLTVVRRKVSKPQESEQRKKKVYELKIDKLLQQYEVGLMVKEVRTINDKEIQKQLLSYEDSLLIERTVYSLGKVVRAEEFSYDNKQRLLEKTERLYNSQEKAQRELVSTYNEQAQLVSKIEYRHGKQIAITSYTYDKHGNLLVRSLYTPNNQKTEKTLYLYQYY